MSSSSVKDPFSESEIDAVSRSLYKPRPIRSLTMPQIHFGVARNQANILRSFTRTLAIQVSLNHPEKPLTAREYWSVISTINRPDLEHQYASILNGQYREEELPPCDASADDA